MAATHHGQGALASLDAVPTGSSTHNLTFSCDRYGNMTCVTNGNTNGPCPSFSFGTSNRITNSGYTYDAAGNLTNDGTHSYQWDAENHLTSINNGTYGSFTYNAYGWRVYNSSGSLSYLLDPSGRFLGGRWSGGGNSAIPLGSRTLAQYQSNGAEFTHVNVLGSETQNTDYAGNGGQGILFYPWGQVWQNPSGAYGNSLYQIFASLQLYDPSTDGYVPPFRYYIPEQGRWITPDKVAGNIVNPQSLNRYAYTLNNPASLIDPVGLCGNPPLGQVWGDPVHCTNPHPAGCTTMNCAWQNYGGSLFFGYVGGPNAICDLDGVQGYCGSVLSGLQNGSSTLISIDATNPSAVAGGSPIAVTIPGGCVTVGPNPPPCNAPSSTYYITGPGLLGGVNIPGLAPQANGTLQALKQFSKGLPQSSPNPTLRQVPDSRTPEEILEEVLPDNILVRLIKAAGAAAEGTLINSGTNYFFPFIILDPCATTPESFPSVCQGPIG